MSGSTVDGSLLSCFTTSIATYMARFGIDYRLVMGTQLFTAVRLDPGQARPLAFVHYHTPLVGEHPTHALHLERHCAPDAIEAADRIAAETRRTGSTLIAGDTHNLPWLALYGRTHAPHWFVASEIDPAAGTVRVVDRSVYLTEGGEQEPYSGRLDVRAVGALARSAPLRAPADQARHTWAFGVRDPMPMPPYSGYQWFEATQPVRSSKTGPATLDALYSATVAYHAGTRRRADLAQDGWSTGVDALRALAHHCAEHLSDADLYGFADDLWVAARTRQLFTTTLADAQLAAWCTHQLIPQWEALPRIARYNTGLLQRGRAPSTRLVDLLYGIADVEHELLDRLSHRLD